MSQTAMPEPSPLSPAARTVLDAYMNNCGWLDGPLERDYRCVAAVLRAVADKLSQEVDAPKVDGSKYAGIWHSYDYLNTIAAELESNG